MRLGDDSAEVSFHLGKKLIQAFQSRVFDLYPLFFRHPRQAYV